MNGSDEVVSGKGTAYEASTLETETTGTALVPVMAWDLALTPHGRVRVALRASDGTQPPVPAAVREAFERGAAFGLLHLGAVEVETDLPPGVAWWRDLARTFVAGLCSTPAANEKKKDLHVPVPVGEIDRAIAAAPPMEGSEYLNAGAVDHLWKEMEEAARIELDGFRGTAQEWLRSKNEVWNRVGRVVFHLAENEEDPQAPFAFLATYTDGVTGKAKPAHRALGGALRRFAGAKNRNALLALLTPVQRAAEKSEVVRSLVQSGDLFHPIAMTAPEAHAFLKELPVLEEAGLTVRVPDFWKRGNPPRPVVQVRIGDLAPGHLGVESLLSFDVGIAVGKHRLTDAEWKKLMDAGDGLVRIKGTWVELNRERLAEMMAAYERAKQAGDGGVAFGEALRLLAGAGPLAESGVATALAAIPGWAEVQSGEWLAKLLARMRAGDASIEPGKGLRATLREYQEKGVTWLWTMASLGMGACLADDMGLGKTIQVLGLVDALRRKKEAQGPHLLVAPATLLANWRAEIDKFMPDLRAVVVHPSLSRKEKWTGEPELVLTSYGFLQKQPELMKRAWDLVVLDEAQAIKNPGSRTSKAVKALSAKRRVALTGTPVENRLGDLWSLFDFLNPGLLGTTKQFKEFTRGMTKSGSFRPLRDLIRPYLLRRLKSEVLGDLPAKTEVVAWCALTDSQAGHYARAVEELRHELGRSKDDPFRRSGVVLAFITRFKQICNHPAQWAGGGAFVAEESGKFLRLAELCSVIAERQEKALVFTQFQEMTEPIAQFLATIFGREGLVLHGATPVAARRKLVDAFQDETGPPFFVISVKAGGTGLNLTAASHVIHFDRWWNPAVESQATDRAHRIGQKNPVLVHKFVCRGTVEDRIEALLQEKNKLSKEILEGGEAAPSLSQMSDEQLMDLFSLDVTRAVKGDE